MKSETVSFEAPWFRRVVQLLTRKNMEGDSPLNLAIRNKNFRCFELMLSILVNANDVFVSKSFLRDLGYMIEIEASTIDLFFDTKMVDNIASKRIEKVKWTIEKESIGMLLSSQLFTKEKIEEYTCPRDKNTPAEDEPKDIVNEDEKFVVKPTL